MATKIQLRRGTRDEWVNYSPEIVLSIGEVGFESDTGKFKIGNGTTGWNSLGYASILPSELISAINTEVTNRNSAISTAKSEAITSANTYTDQHTPVAGTDFIAFSEKGTAGGVATLDGSGLVPDSQINSDIARSSDVTSAISTAKGQANTYTDQQIAALIDSAPSILDTLKKIDEAISNDANFSTTILADIATAQSTAESYTDSHIATEVTNRNSAIATAKSQAITTAEGYTDSAISTEVTNRNSAIATAKSDAEGYTDSAISTEVTNRNSAIATAKSQAITAAEGYTDSAISTEVTNRNSAIATAKSDAEGYTDSAISTEVTNRNSAIATAKSQAITAAEGYTDTAVANLVNSAPSTLDTLKELADAINDDASFAATVTTALGTKLSTATAATTYAPLASPTFTGTPTAPTVAAADNSTNIATTAYVDRAAGAVIPSQSGEANKFLQTNGTSLSWTEIPITILGPISLTTNSPFLIDETPIDGFDLIEYTVYIKQGTLFRASKLFVLSDGTDVSADEYAISELGGLMNGVSVSASVDGGTRVILQVQILDASTSNASIKLIKSVV